jgi:hypothetical protein
VLRKGKNENVILNDQYNMSYNLKVDTL